MGASQRRKGTVGEQEVARLLRAEGLEIERVPNSGGLDTKGDLLGLPDWHLEVKRQERLNIWSAIKQSADEAPEGATPAVIFRRNHEHWNVVVPFDVWVRLVKLELQSEDQ